MMHILYFTWKCQNFTGTRSWSLCRLRDVYKTEPSCLWNTAFLHIHTYSCSTAIAEVTSGSSRFGCLWDILLFSVDFLQLKQNSDLSAVLTVRSTVAVCWIYLTNKNSPILSLGKSQNLHGVKSGECVGWEIVWNCFYTKNCVTQYIVMIQDPIVSPLLWPFLPNQNSLFILQGQTHDHIKMACRCAHDF